MCSLSIAHIAQSHMLGYRLSKLLDSKSRIVLMHKVIALGMPGCDLCVLAVIFAESKGL